MDTTEDLLSLFNATSFHEDITTFPTATTRSLPTLVVHAHVLRDVYIWILVAVGLPGNAACVATILAMPASPFYVALLAIADSAALLAKLVYHQIYSHDALTDAGCYFSGVVPFLGCYANWVLALICVERYVAVCWPFRKQELFTKKKVYVSSLGLLLLLFALFLPTCFFFQGANDSGSACVLPEGGGGLTKYKNTAWEKGILPALAFFGPFLIVFVFTALIVHRLMQQRRHRRARLSNSNRTSEGGNGGRAERTISIMLTSAAGVFVVLMLPACLYHMALKNLFQQNRARGYLFYQVVTVLYDSNHAVNFFVYFLSAARFRKAFLDVLLQRCPCCWWCWCCRRGDRKAVSRKASHSTSQDQLSRDHVEHVELVEEGGV